MNYAYVMSVGEWNPTCLKLQLKWQVEFIYLPRADTLKN